MCCSSCSPLLTVQNFQIPAVLMRNLRLWCVITLRQPSTNMPLPGYVRQQLQPHAYRAVPYEHRHHAVVFRCFVWGACRGSFCTQMPPPFCLTSNANKLQQPPYPHPTHNIHTHYPTPAHTRRHIHTIHACLCTHARTRTHTRICTQSKLLAHPSVADHTLADLPTASSDTPIASGSTRKGGAAGKAGAVKASGAAAAKGKGQGPAAAAALSEKTMQPVLLFIDTAG